MTTTIFDTLQYAKKLRDAGVPEKQAEMHAEMQAETLAKIVDEKIATKQDLKELEAAMHLKVAAQTAEIIKWVAAMLVAQAAVIAALVKLLK